MKTTLCVGDMHLPFEDEKALLKIYSLVDILKPERIVQIGDLYDHYSYSRFVKSSEVRPYEELIDGREKAKAFWLEIRRRAPKAECIQILGNHCVRPLKRVGESIPEAEFLIVKSFKELYTFKKVITYLDPREVIVRDDIAFIHGWKSRLGDHMLELGLRTVCGHSHRGGVVYKKHLGKTLWELNCGFIADQKTKALSYTPSKITQWTLGCGFIDAHGPRFIPF